MFKKLKTDSLSVRILALLSIIVSVLILCCFPSRSVAADSSDKILYEKNSLYQYIAVIENVDKKERYIQNVKRNYMQGGIYVDNPDKLLYEYTKFSFISLAFMDREPRNALFVGLGAGAMPRYFNMRYPEVPIDVVEIDPDIVEVAKKYFHFKENENCTVHVMDGRMYIKRASKIYDMIFLDAYQNDYIPFHLTTVEFLKEVKKKLSPDGVVVANITSPFKNKLFYAMINTYKEVFPHLYIFKGIKSNNYIFIATADEKKLEGKTITKRAREIQAARKFDYDLAKIGSLYAYYTEFKWKSDILTDDFAPVNIYKHMKVDK